MSDFYGFSQSEGISQGNALTDQVKSNGDTHDSSLEAS